MIDNLDSRIEAAKNRNTKHVPDSIVDGSTPLAPPSPGRGVDATIRVSDAVKLAENEAARRVRPMAQATFIDRNAKPQAGGIKVGGMTLQPSSIIGTWEGKFTPNAGPWELITESGEAVYDSMAILDLIASLLKEQAR
jgi:hypothetical protein